MRDTSDHVAMLWHPIQGPPAEGPASAKGSYPTPVRCDLCAQRCTIVDGRRGLCQVRENRAGVLYTLVYGELVAQAVDPIEKKPLFHFHPGSRALSIATAGCNLSCTFCQNADISQGLKDGLALRGRRTAPEQVVEAAVRERCASIAYTYTEPTIFFEFAYDTGRLAHERGLADVWVSNGFMTPEMLDTVTSPDAPPLIDAANIDLKAFTETYYRQQCGARLQPVLDNLVQMKQRGVWLEVTTLIIPGLNDAEDELRQIAAFIHDSLSPDTPWHVSRFHPTYRLLDRPSTPVSTLLRAREIGLEAGLQYVYTGNIPGQGGEDTLCPACGATVITRSGFSVHANRAAGGRCARCGGTIAGVGL
ncbi:MAG: AmmeMemoRadiSam system radical SAM enzyme [Anaerolineae bacterium]